MVNVFPQNGDKDSGNNFSLWTSRKNISDYAHKGLKLQADFSTNMLDVTGGYAFITHNDEDKVLQADSGELTGYGFTDGVTNHVFLHSNFATDNNLTVVVNTTGSAPNGAALKIGEVDAVNNTVRETNRKPVVEARSATIDSLNLQGSTTMKDEQKMFFGSNKDFSISYSDAENVLKITDEINNQDIIEYGKGGVWRSDDGIALNDDKEAIFGTDNDFSFVYDSSSNTLELRNKSSGTLLMEAEKSDTVSFNANANVETGSELTFGGSNGYSIHHSNDTDKVYFRDAGNNVSAFEIMRGGNMRIFESMNFALNEAENLVIDRRTSDPNDPEVGQIWMRTDLQ